MTCDRMQGSIFGDGERPEGFDAHLASCAGCREALAGHTAALALRGANVVVPPVRFGLSPGRLALVAAVVIVVVTVPISKLVKLSEHDDGAFAPALKQAVKTPSAEFPLTAMPLETEMKAPQAVALAEPLDEEQRLWRQVWQVRAAVAWDLHRDVTVSDTTYSAFGALPSWLAPRPAVVMDDGSLVPSPEEAP